MAKQSESKAAEQAEQERLQADADRAEQEQAEVIASTEGQDRTGPPPLFKRAVGFPRESELTTEQVIQRRTTGDWPDDGRFYKVYAVEAPRVSTGTAPDLDWSAPEHDALHEANKVAILQEALNRGLHPQQEASFDGARDEDGALVYSVAVIPASGDERAAATVTPSKAIADLGGSTVPSE